MIIQKYIFKINIYIYIYAFVPGERRINLIFNLDREKLWHGIFHIYLRQVDVKTKSTMKARSYCITNEAN